MEEEEVTSELFLHWHTATFHKQDLAPLMEQKLWGIASVLILFLSFGGIVVCDWNFDWVFAKLMQNYI